MKAGRKTGWLQGLAAAALMAAGAAQAQAPQPSPGTAIAIMQASAAVESGDCAAARPPLNQLWNDPYFELADPAMAARMRASLIACIAQTEGMKPAIARSAENISRAGSGIEAHDLHVFLLLLDGQSVPAAAALNHALVKLPETAANLSDMSVMGVALYLRASDPDAAHGLMNRLQDAKWQVRQPWMRPVIGLMRMDALRRAVAEGDLGHAASYRADIARDSLVYVLSQGDGTITDPAWQPIDVRPVIAAEIAAAQSHITGNPADLLTLSYLMMLERANGQDVLALTQLEGILALVDKHGLQNFQSIDSYPGLLGDRAALLADMGRHIEADKAFKDGLALLTPEAGNGLALSYMNYLTDSGREAEALKLSAGLDPALMDEGEILWFHEIRACAHAYRGDEPAYANAMVALVASPSSRIKPFLCAGDSDGAVLAVIAALNDPADRQDMIMFMQDGVHPIPYSVRDQAYVEALLALKQRPDVVAAAQGARINIRTWPLRF